MAVPDPPPEAPVFDYDALVAAYHDGLVDRLRGFDAGASALARWVPDEDPRSGIVNMVDAATSEGCRQFAIRVSGPTWRSVDADALIAEIEEFGNVACRPGDEEARLLEIDAVGDAPRCANDPTRSSDRAPSRLPSIVRTEHPNSTCAPHEAYAPALSQAARERRHEHPPPNDARGIASASRDRIELWLKISDEDHSVVACGYHRRELSHREDTFLGALELLCRDMVGLPLVEAADHGASRVEYRIRKTLRSPPRPGIALSGSLHPAFDFAATLVREAWRGYARTRELSLTDNRHDPGCRPTWLADSLARRHDQLNAEIAHFLDHSKLETDTVELVELEIDLRVIIAIADACPADRKAQLAFDLEAHLRDALEPRLEVFFQERKDHNKLRRLSVIEAP